MNPNKREPFGWAPGTVRSLIVLVLVGALVVFGMMFGVAVILRGADEVVARVLEALVGTVSTLAGIAVGYYFGNRSTTEKG